MAVTVSMSSARVWTGFVWPLGRTMRDAMRELVRRKSSLFGVVVALGVSASMPALAQPASPAVEPTPASSDPYKQHMTAGVAMFQDKNYDGAVVEFEAAYREKPRRARSSI